MNSLSLLNFSLDSETACFPTNAFRVGGKDAGFHNGAIFYSEKYDMIIACPSDKTVQFYNPTTLLPIKRRKTLQLKSSVLQISYCAKTDVCLLMCQYGNIYFYDLSKHLLIQEQKANERPRPRDIIRDFFDGPVFEPSNQIIFLNSEYYAFSSAQSKQISVGKFGDERTTILGQESVVNCLWKSERGRFLFAGFADGSMRVYRLPEISIVDTVKNRKVGGYIVKIEDIMIKRKEYVIAAESDGMIRIWQLTRGKLRLLRVINTGEKISWFVYLEKYQMIVTAHAKEYIRYWSLASGKLKFRYYSDVIKSQEVFLMNGKNAIGVADYKKNMIEIVPLNFKEDREGDKM